MRSLASRKSLDASTDTLLTAGETLDDASLRTLAEELATVSSMLRREVSLRRALADATIPAASKIGVIGQLFGGKVSAPTGVVLEQVVGSEWSRGRDVSDAIASLSRTAMFLRAEREGELDAVEDEIFRFGRILEANPRLASLVDDPNASPQRRSELVNELLAGKVRPLTVELLTALAMDTRGRSFSHGVDELVQQAAQRNDKAVAIVTSAVELTSDQNRRLTAALARIYGRPVAVHVQVDPDIKGGLVVQVGDEVIDGSISGRLDEVRSRLAG